MAVLRFLLLATYPFLVWFALDHVQPRTLALGLLVLFVWRFRGRVNGLLKGLMPAVLAGIMLLGCVSLIAVFSNDEHLLRLFPAAVNAVFLIVFASSLYHPPSFVERLARLRRPDLPPEAIIYTRQVTMIWCGFFVLNGSVTVWMAWFSSRAEWALYTGLISYLLMGVVMGGEWLFRWWRFGREAVL